MRVFEVSIAYCIDHIPCIRPISTREVNLFEDEMVHVRYDTSKTAIHALIDCPRR
jgi:hypothetical protein